MREPLRDGPSRVPGGTRALIAFWAVGVVLLSCSATAWGQGWESGRSALSWRGPSFFRAEAYAEQGDRLSPLQRQRLQRRVDRGLPPPPRTRDRVRNYERLSPEEKAKLKGRFRDYRSLPPPQREDLRKRMEQWRRLPPQDRDLYRKRFDQWRNLSPDERSRYREKLRQGDRLSPQEREEIRRRFGGK